MATEAATAPGSKPGWVALSEMKVGRVYRLEGRRQVYGVWNGRVLVGLQWEFGSRELFHESHWDDRGSAKPLEMVAALPSEVEPTEGWVACRICGHRIGFAGESQAYAHLSDPTDGHAALSAGFQPNLRLYEWLMNFEDEQGIVQQPGS